MRYEGRAGDALVRIHGALHDCKKEEGEREGERERVDMGAPSCSDWQKSASSPPQEILGTRTRASIVRPMRRAAESNMEGTDRVEPDEMTEPPRREMDRIMGRGGGEGRAERKREGGDDERWCSGEGPDARQ